MPITKGLNFVAGIMRDLFPTNPAEDNQEGGIALGAIEDKNTAQMNDHDAAATDTTMSDDTLQGDDDEPMPELLPVEVDEQGYTPISQYDGVPRDWEKANRTTCRTANHASSSGWGYAKRTTRGSSTALSSIDISQLETIDLTGGEAPLVSTRMVYQSYDDDDLDAVLTAGENDIDAVMNAVEEVMEKAADKEEREADEIVDAATTAARMVQMQRVVPAALEDSSGSDSDIEIFQTRKALLRSSMTRAATHSQANRGAWTINAMTNVDSEMIQDDSDTDTTTTKKSPSSEDSTRNSTVTSTSRTSLASQLTRADPIEVPQVIGKGAYTNPSLLDPFLASPVLLQLLEDGALPPSVLWACYLKNNTLCLDYSAACDNLSVWLDAHPSRYKNVTSILLDEVLHHPHVTRQKAGQRKWSVYRPFRLLAQCPNLSHLTLRFDIEDLPGFSEWWPEPQKMGKTFDRRYRMYKLMACVPRTLRSLRVEIEVNKRLVEKVAKQRVMWRHTLVEYFEMAAELAGWGTEEITALEMKVEFKEYRMFD